MARLALPSQLPSVGISLGESVSDLFQINVPLRVSISSFCEVGVLTQYAKNLSMVMVAPLLLVMSIPSSLAFGFVSALSDTDPHSGSIGGMGVNVGVKVGVFVDVEVNVEVGVFVRVGVLVREGVRDGRGVLVGPGVVVGLGVFVRVGRGVGPGEPVEEGSTKRVLVGGTVDDGVGERVGGSTMVGVDVI